MQMIGIRAAGSRGRQLQRQLRLRLHARSLQQDLLQQQQQQLLVQQPMQQQLLHAAPQASHVRSFSAAAAAAAAAVPAAIGPLRVPLHLLEGLGGNVAAAAAVVLQPLQGIEASSNNHSGISVSPDEVSLRIRSSVALAELLLPSSSSSSSSGGTEGLWQWYGCLLLGPDARSSSSSSSSSSSKGYVAAADAAAVLAVAEAFAAKGYHDFRAWRSLLAAAEACMQQQLQQQQQQKWDDSSIKAAAASCKQQIECLAEQSAGAAFAAPAPTAAGAAGVSKSSSNRSSTGDVLQQVVFGDLRVLQLQRAAAAVGAEWPWGRQLLQQLLQRTVHLTDITSGIE